MAITVLLPPDEDDGTCPVRSILDRVGDRWTALVISNLAGGPLRFTELKRRVKGISQRMLTETLRGLERDGMVTRTMFPTIPPRLLLGSGVVRLGPGSWAAGVWCASRSGSS